MGVFLSLVFGFIPALFYAWFVYWLDRFEKEPRRLLGGAFLWGAVVASAGAFLVNTLLGIGIYSFTGSESLTTLSTGSLIAPIVEESLKGLAVLVIFLVFRQEFDSLLDGLIYAAVVALGFSAAENSFYIYQFGYTQGGLSALFAMAFVRVILVGWQHPFYTAFIGIGLAASRMNRSTWISILAPFLGWCLAVFTHSFHNTLASLLEGPGGLVLSTLVDWTGWLFMFLVVLWAISIEQRYIALHLREEVELGVISAPQYLTARSAWSQSLARFGSLLNGAYRETNRFYQVCAELAHKKHQLNRLGEEQGNSIAVERLRGELQDLSLRARTK